MKPEQEYFEANRRLWEGRTPVHLGSEFYNVPAFEAGASTLNKIELDGVGPVAGKSLLHLQCHFGMDTLSWARMGATVTGVDFSSSAIEAANNLSRKVNVPGQFICCNVYDLDQHLDKEFDIVFTSYGTIGWLPDLDRWAKIVARFLRSGGMFYIADFHPVVWMLDEDFRHVKYAYHNNGPIVSESENTYADRSATTAPQKEYGWNHSLSEIINALIGQGLRIESLEEFSYSPYNCFNHLQQGPDNMWRIEGMDDKLPMVYAIKAVKP